MAAQSKHTSGGRRRTPSASDQVLPAAVRAGGRLTPAVAVLVVATVVTGCGATGAGTAAPDASAAATAGRTPLASHSTRGERPMTGVDAPAPELPERLPGLGPGTLARIPARTRQVVLVTGQGRNSDRSQVVLYRRGSAGWQAGARWAAHNALKGWTDDHHAGDLRSPVGVFSLSDAGGLLPDPGAKLPYTHSRGFAIGGTGFDGELLRTLDPALHPVVVMGDAASLSR